MKVAIIRTSAKILDTQFYNIQEVGLAKSLIKNGISVDIFSIFGNLEKEEIIFYENSSHLKLIPLKGVTIFNQLTYFPTLTSRIIKGGYDLVQVHEDTQFMTPVILRKCSKKKLKTVLYQGMYINFSGVFRIFQKIFDFVFKNQIINNVDTVLAKTEMAKKYLENKGYENIYVIPIGLDRSNEKADYVNNHQFKRFKKRFSKLLLYVGKIESRRNPYFLIDFFDIIRNKISVGLVIIGDGPMHSDLMKYIKEKNLENDVYMEKIVLNTQIDKIFKQCDLLLLPTTHEIFGMVILEALSYGIPVISGPEAGPLTILKEDSYGMCVELDINMWVDAVQRILFNEEKENIVQLRKEYIERNYNWETISKEYINHLKLYENTENKY